MITLILSSLCLRPKMRRDKPATAPVTRRQAPAMSRAAPCAGLLTVCRKPRTPCTSRVTGRRSGAVEQTATALAETEGALLERAEGAGPLLGCAAGAARTWAPLSPPSQPTVRVCRAFLWPRPAAALGFLPSVAPTGAPAGSSPADPTGCPLATTDAAIFPSSTDTCATWCTPGRDGALDASSWGVPAGRPPLPCCRPLSLPLGHPGQPPWACSCARRRTGHPAAAASAAGAPECCSCGQSARCRCT